MKERIVIVFIAALIGLLITTLGFFVYESSKNIPEEKPKTATKPLKTEDIAQKINLAVSEPINESVTDKRTIQVKGKTDSQNLLVVSSNQEDVMGTPTNDGNFAVTIKIDAGTNIIVSRTIAPNGETKIDERIVTYSTEEF